MVQKPVIHWLDHVPVNDFLELFQIENHSRDRIRLAFECHLENVIVPVPMRVGCRSVHRMVFRI